MEVEARNPKVGVEEEGLDTVVSDRRSLADR